MSQWLGSAFGYFAVQSFGVEVVEDVEDVEVAKGVDGTERVQDV